MSKSGLKIKDPKGLLYYGGTVFYVVGAYGLGFAGLFAEQWAINAVATLLLAHAMTIAAYMIHECGHNLVFEHSRHNAVLGRFMSWICGAAYGTYEDMRYKHFRHHVDNDDVVWFEYEEYFEKHPFVLRMVERAASVDVVGGALGWYSWCSRVEVRSVVSCACRRTLGRRWSSCTSRAWARRAT